MINILNMENGGGIYEEIVLVCVFWMYDLKMG